MRGLRQACSLGAFALAALFGCAGTDEDASSPCQNVCEQNATRCSPVDSARIQTCSVASNGCTDWVEAEPCPRSMVCLRASGACADPRWAEWPAPNTLVDVAQGAPNAQSYTVSDDGTVLDDVTGLIWQQATGTPTIWIEEATAYCAGFGSGWRLPSKIELLSLVDYGRRDPAIDPLAFPQTPSELYWTSTPGPDGQPWSVEFLEGETAVLGFGASATTRCVR